MMLLDIFESEAKISPDAASLIQEDGRSFTYRQLDDIATYLGRELACAIKVAPVDSGRDETPLVAVMMTRGVGLVSAILGILKAGAAYVPVDPAFPPDRQTHIFAHSKCQVLITDSESLALALSLGVVVPPTLVVDSGAIGMHSAFSGYNFISKSLHLPCFREMNKDVVLREAREKVATREDGGLAYVLYTSGSTGKPKGVMVKQLGVVNIVNYFADQLAVGRFSRVLGLTTFCFDISVLEMFLPLVRGAALVMVNQSSQKDPFQLLDVIRDTKVTVVQATPTTFEMLFATGWTGDESTDFLVGGEAFRPSILKLAEKSKSLRNVYGPTETTIWSSSYHFPKNITTLLSNNGVPIIPIGLPITKTLFYIVTEDETLPKKISKIGEEGELWIGGVGVAKGYLHAPELTVEKFFKNPFGPGMVYRTGDIVKRLDKGQGDYLFVRRMDDQVKIDGFRIELAEIETVFSSHHLLDKAVAVVRDGKLALYITTKNEKPLEHGQKQDLITYSARSLTHYMMPKYITHVNRFPETANGKLDRKALPDPKQLDLCDHQSSPEENGLEKTKDDDCDDENEDENEDDSCMESKSNESSPAFTLKNMINGATVTPTIGSNSCFSSTQGRKTNELKKAKIAMAHHICDIVEKVRGRRPLLSNSFAQIGVDSLGAVMFIKYLSDSVGGIRIEPAKIYAPGVTVRTFAEDLYKRLLTENPDALTKLGIRSTVHETTSLNAIHEEVVLKNDETHHHYNNKDDDADIVSLDDNEEEEEYEGYQDVQKMESAFGDILTSNRSLIEGLRGFTTSFQLRETPTFVLKAIDTEDDADQSNPNYKEVEDGNNQRNHRYVLDRRQKLNFRSFIGSRLVGLLPILWLALLLNIPPWIQDNRKPIPINTKVGCTIMYIVAMQSWWRPQCGQYGANNVLYASILVNCFIIYAIIRLGIVYVQNYLMTWASEDISPVTLQPPEHKMKNRTWKQFVGDNAVRLAYNRTNAKMMLVMMLFFFILGEGLFAVMYFNTIAKNALTFIPYFFVGCFAASVLENIHVAIWDWDREEKEKIKRSEPIDPNSAIRFLYDVIHYTSNKATRPWVHENFYFSYFYVSQPHPSLLTSSGIATESSQGEITPKRKLISNPVQIEMEKRSFFFLSCYQLWRFLPDLISISIGFLMSTLGTLYTDITVGSLLWFIILPTVFLAFFIVNMLQKGSARYNFSRFFLESAPIATMGYASYAMYLFQRIAFTFFAPYFYFGVKNHQLDMNIGDPNKWFERLNGGYKLIAVVVFTIICWLVHKYYQDVFITYLYAKFLSRKKAIK